MVGRVPWQIGEVDGDDLKLEVTVMDKDYRERMREEAADEAVPRRMFIRVLDVDEHGYALRCPGCVTILRGTARQEHSADCRRGLEKKGVWNDRASEEGEEEDGVSCGKEYGGRRRREKKEKGREGEG